MLAQITLNEMEFYAYHGVFDQEKKVGHRYIVSLTVTFDCSKALTSDCVDDTVNYALLHQVVKEEMEIRSNLIEHLTGRIANHILTKFPPVTEVTVEISKCAPPLQGAIKAASFKLTLAK